MQHTKTMYAAFVLTTFASLNCDPEVSPALDSEQADLLDVDSVLQEMAQDGLDDSDGAYPEEPAAADDEPLFTNTVGLELTEETEFLDLSVPNTAYRITVSAENEAELLQTPIMLPWGEASFGELLDNHLADASVQQFSEGRRIIMHLNQGVRNPYIYRPGDSEGCIKIVIEIHIPCRWWTLCW